MMNFPSQKIEHELINARSFLARGENGKSRVSARKAAGFALRFWLETKHGVKQHISPFAALETCQNLYFLPETWREAIDHLLLKVSPGYEFPEEIDLIFEAEKIIDAVQNECKE